MAADPIFEPFRCGALNLANRLVALPVFTGYATADGRVSPLLKSHYRRLASCGAGLVMVANVAVRADGITSRCNLRLDNDRYIAGLADLARVIHSGGALAGLQLNHAGRLALTDQPLAPAPLDGANLTFNIAALKRFMEFFPLPARFALTRRFWRQAGAWRNAMSIEARQEVIEAFARAANRAATAGFDLVEIHGASGYLLCQFLSAFTNPPVTPDDPDDLVRRLVFPLTLFKRVRDALEPGVPLGWRLMVSEFVPNGIDLDQAKALGRELARAGAAYLSVSAGTFYSLFADQVRRVTRRPGYLGSACAELRRELAIPVVAAGRIVTPGRGPAYLGFRPGRPHRFGPAAAGRCQMAAKGAPGAIGARLSRLQLVFAAGGPRPGAGLRALVPAAPGTHRDDPARHGPARLLALDRRRAGRHAPLP